MAFVDRIEQGQDQGKGSELGTSIEGEDGAGTHRSYDRAATEAALIDAATQLFDRRNPGSVSVREIARLAGVNHGLVHHYFGSKQALVQAVLDHLTTRARDSLAAGTAMDQDSPVQTYTRILGRVMLEEPNLTPLPGDHPILVQLASLARDVGGLDERSARIRASQGAALAMGWLIFEPLLIQSGGLEGEDPAFLRDQLRVMIAHMAVPIAEGT
ncbi:MAG: TetR/AcrR family transcriptional regulator, repressor for neighboring sulfatase [Acidimicrobiaceae bacterium]|jgi:AcrR family transcriptional regulator|nr:TetR/AcrR family transcriptional regulator, repressor for neighboring sulfatase [Acidimicrobiaceae bacterium]